MKITFFGGAGTVTGSKYLIEHNDAKILVDCGLFQGVWELTQHNWDPFPIPPETVDAIVVTHAHIDHTGYIPALIKNGFKGPVYCSRATYETCTVLLPDSGNLQEEEAKYHNHHQLPPLYTRQDAEYALRFFKTVAYDTIIQIKSLHVMLIRSGHVLGSAFVTVSDGKQKLTFSGDLGRPEQPLLKTPPPLKQTDYLVLESTYGDRVHEHEDPEEALKAVVHETVQKGGALIIPSFSLMRTQTILYYLYLLKQKNNIPNNVPIFLDSPSGIRITDFFCKFSEEYSISPSVCEAALSVATATPSVEDSKKIDHLRTSAIIIAGSGMADGGRIPYHLQQFISDAKNTILFVGYQAKGSKGRYLIDGEKKIRIHGNEYPVHAQIRSIRGLSAHADSQEIIAWLEHFETKPKKVFLIHGEPEAAQALKKKIEARFGWLVIIPKYLESSELD